MMHIREIVAATEIPASTLRYYEKKKLLQVQRDAAGCRDYVDQDIAWVQFIQRLKDTGMLLRDIQRYAALRYEGDSTMPERLEMLRRHREYVLAQQAKWQEYREHLEQKMAFYEEYIGKMQ
jgi:DNA-binding transcriptional MerR regulator